MVGVLQNYCNRERQTSDLCSLVDEALHSAPPTRYDKLAIVYRGSAVLRAISRWLKHLGNTT